MSLKSCTYMTCARSICFWLLWRLHPQRFDLRLGQRRQEQGRQNGDDGNYNQQFDQSEGPPALERNFSLSLDWLACATILKVSQALSGEVVFAKLIDTLMRMALEQAGAERGLLILPRGTELRIAAAATTLPAAVAVEFRDEAVAPATLPESVLHYVLRTREFLVLEEAASRPDFAADPYIRGHQSRSVLCLPLLNQAKLIGVLYLENNLAPRVFASTQIAVLRLLASQAAISLENARLYRDLAEREAKIRRLVDANIIGIFIRSLGTEVDGPIVEANDAFLRMVGFDREDLNAGRIRWATLIEYSRDKAKARQIPVISGCRRRDSFGEDCPMTFSGMSDGIR